MCGRGSQTSLSDFLSQAKGIEGTTFAAHNQLGPSFVTFACKVGSLAKSHCSHGKRSAALKLYPEHQPRGSYTSSFEQIDTCQQGISFGKASIEKCDESSPLHINADTIVEVCDIPTM